MHPPLQTANNYTAACDIDNCKGVIYNNCMSKLRIRDELDACTTYVFVSKVVPANSISILYPPQRQQQIDQCQSAKVKAEKYTSWKLLEYALKELYDVAITDVQFFLANNGKWSCDKCHFSISHSDGVVAVAVDAHPVGIDIENTQNVKFTPKLANRIMTDEEFITYLNNGEKTQYICEVWCKKEALFKQRGVGVFAAKLLQTEDTNDFCLHNLHYDGKVFFMALANNTPIFRVIEVQL